MTYLQLEQQLKIHMMGYYDKSIQPKSCFFNSNYKSKVGVLSKVPLGRPIWVVDFVQVCMTNELGHLIAHLHKQSSCVWFKAHRVVDLVEF